jgi:uncharacterized protein YeaO (DUF488 family)
MSRHTLDDGVTPDTRITRDLYDEWLHSLAPTDKLVGDYYKRGLPWEEFEERYLAYLGEGKRPLLLRALGELARVHDITLLCIEETPEFCHRRLLAEECQRLTPGLEIHVQ